MIMRRSVVLSICIGLVLEVLMFLSLLPKNSMQPMTPWQKWGGYTQAPGFAVFGLLGMTFGHSLDRLPRPIGYGGVILIMSFAAFAQVAVFAFPIWVLLSRFRLWRS